MIKKKKKKGAGQGWFIVQFVYTLFRTALLVQIECVVEVAGNCISIILCTFHYY